MMGTVKRCLITARDPASANDLSAVLPSLIDAQGLEICVVAQEPAFALIQANLAAKGVTPQAGLQCMDKLNDAGIETELVAILARFRPDLLISGVSGPDHGIDEIALRLCNSAEGTHTFAVQSYWGDMNTCFNSPAESMFVLDGFAAEVTVRRHSGICTIITGSLQAEKYTAFDQFAARADFRAQMEPLGTRQVIAFFGQPLFEYSWYRDTLSHFAQVMAKDFTEVELVYKPHPKESQESIDWTVRHLAGEGRCCHLLREISPLTLLAGTDLAVSLFSTVGYDLQHLLTHSSMAYSAPLYLFYEKGCREWFREYCYLDEIPMTREDMALVADRPEILQTKIRQGLDGDFKTHCHQSIKRNFSTGGASAADVILSAICT